MDKNVIYEQKTYQMDGAMISEYKPIAGGKSIFIAYYALRSPQMAEMPPIDCQVEIQANNITEAFMASSDAIKADAKIKQEEINTEIKKAQQAILLANPGDINKLIGKVK